MASHRARTPESGGVELYRVFPCLPQAAPDEPGGALYIPPQSGGRLDNPDLYSVFYASNAAAGAVAESFGRFPEWTSVILEGSPALPGSFRAIAQYRLAESAAVCDLDDPTQLVALGLRPSDIVSRDYTRTRAWARRIYLQGAWAAVRWWSYYDPRWTSFGVWGRSSLSLEDVRALRLDDRAMIEAARTIARRIIA
jgi:RES domain